MKWIKASERLPENPGRYFVKTDRQFIPNNAEKNQVATFTSHKEWYLENHHHSNDFFYLKPYEWLDESTPAPRDEEIETLKAEISLLREALRLKDEQIENYKFDF